MRLFESDLEMESEYSDFDQSGAPGRIDRRAPCGVSCQRRVMWARDAASEVADGQLECPAFVA